jgi:hypothetical protein
MREAIACGKLKRRQQSRIIHTDGIDECSVTRLYLDVNIIKLKPVMVQPFQNK